MVNLRLCIGDCETPVSKFETKTKAGLCIRAWDVTIKKARARDSKGQKFRGNGINKAK